MQYQAGCHPQHFPQIFIHSWPTKEKCILNQFWKERRRKKYQFKYLVIFLHLFSYLPFRHLHSQILGVQWQTLVPASVGHSSPPFRRWNWAGNTSTTSSWPGSVLGTNYIVGPEFQCSTVLVSQCSAGSIVGLQSRALHYSPYTTLHYGAVHSVRVNIAFYYQVFFIYRPSTQNCWELLVGQTCRLLD